MEVEQQQRFPMQLVQDLCRDLEKENLKFFKRDKKATFVCRTRPHFIDDESHLSPRLRSIVGVVRANPNITVGKLVSVLAPHVEKPGPKADPAAGKASSGEPVTAEPAPSPATPPANADATTGIAPAVGALTEVPAAESSPAADPASTAASPDAPASPEATTGDSAAEPVETEVPSAGPNQPSQSPPNREPRERGPKHQRGKKPAPAAPESPPAPLTPEEIGVLQDLRWLVQEGFVTEFANSELQLLGRPPQPPAEKKPKGDPKASAVNAGAGPVEAASSSPTETPAPAIQEDPTHAETSEAVTAAPATDGTPEPAAEPTSSPVSEEISPGSEDPNTPSASGEQPLL
jgi:hypothetical protein